MGVETEKKVRVVKPPALRPVVSVVGYREVSPNFVLGPRHLPRPNLIFVAEGRLLFKTEGEDERRLRRGDALLIYPQETHTLKRDTDAQTVVAYAHHEPVRNATWASGEYRIEPAPRRVTHTVNDPDMRELFRRAGDVFSAYTPYRDAMLEGIVREIWLRLAIYWLGQGQGHLSGRMRRMVRFLRRNMAEPVSRLDLADEFDLTPEHVNYLFKKELGTSPTAFVNRERIHRAYHLLHEGDLTVQEVAEQVGFNDQFYFSRMFKKIMGIPPSRVR